MNRREFLRHAGASAAALGAAGSAATADGAGQGAPEAVATAVAAGPGPSAAESRPGRRPNILWIIAEDFGPHLGCYGTRQVHSPNLDRLAAEGVRYTHFYTTAPVCSPSRSAFMTGLYQTTIGAHQHRSHRDDGYRLPEGVRVLTDLLRDAGYFTVNVRQFPRGLDLRGTAKTDWNFTYVGQPFDSDRWEDLKGRQPFYAQVNFTETHRPFKAPKRADPKAVPIPPYYPDDPITRADMAAYLDSASELDRKVGRVLDQLQADGLADDTIVLFFGDNGEAHHRGKCFCYEEGLHVPLILRWPKNFPAPRHGAPGTADDRLLMAIDLAPTMLAAAGAAVPPVMQGRAFLGEIARGDPPRRAAGAPREYAFGARDRCDEVSMRLRTVRDRRFRYIRNFTPEVPFTTPQKYRQDQYPVWNLLLAMKAEGRVEPPISAFCADRMPEEELYDLLADPHQVRNLAADPAHRGTLERLRGVLEKWIEETADQGRTPEPPEVAARKGLTKPGGNPGASAIRPR